MVSDMKIFRLLPRWTGPAAMLCVLALTGCGSDNSITDPGGGSGTEPPPVEVTDLTMLTSSPQLPSDGASPATITAIVRDANNNVVEGVGVVFSADSGALTVLTSITNADGVAQASLATAGDPTSRTITVQGITGNLNTSVQVDVSGTMMVITGAPNVVFGDTVQYSIQLQDSSGAGISNETIDVSSASGNTLAAASLVTDSEGLATIDLTATVSGADTLSAMALSGSANAFIDITVSNDSFTFLSPPSNTEVNLGAIEPVTVEWLINGVPQTGTVNFFTTRGTLSSGSEPLDGSGRATVDITSNNAGPASISASIPNGPITQLPIEFVATTPAKIDVQASRFTVGPGGQSTIGATVRDPNDNPVKGKVVVFELTDVTGGFISVGGQTTNSNGRAETVYTAGQTVSGADGVEVRAFVQEDPTVEDTVNLTVAQQEVDISIGTGNQIEEPNTADYLKEFSVRVTDSQGVGVANVDVQLSVFSKTYVKGIYVPDTINDVWAPLASAFCQDEDVNRNGQLDPGEDFNNSGSIEAGNVATVAPGSIITDQNGFGLVELSYAQEFGSWVEVTIQAKAAVTGTEFLETEDYTLEVLRSDVALSNSPPGGLVSRWGQTPDCGTLD